MTKTYLDKAPPLGLRWEDFVAPVMSDFHVHGPVRDDIGVWAPSLTRQEFAEECDINTLMARYEAGGAISHVNKAQPVFMDVVGFPDLREALDYMRDATIAFQALPAAVRREFDHDPQKFVDYAQDPTNIERMRGWGLAAPAPAPVEPMMVRVVPEADASDLGDAPKAPKPPKA